MRYVALIAVCGTFGFLLGRYLFPVIFDGGVLFLVLALMLVAAVLFARTARRGRSKR